MTAKRFQFSGVRVVAVFEAAKALFLLLVGFGLFSLINRDTEAFAEYLVRHLHLNPAHKYPHIFIATAKHVTNPQLWLFATVAIVDAVVRFVEAVGLWRERDWAKWLGLVTAALYLPIEVYELWIHVTWLKTATFVTNIVIVVYLGYSLHLSKQSADSITEVSKNPDV